MSRRFTEAEITEVWERRKAGELTRSIARRLGRNGSSIRRVFEDVGGVRAAPLADRGALNAAPDLEGADEGRFRSWLKRVVIRGASFITQEQAADHNGDARG